ncbi:MAG TPA: response regulator [Thermoanaerobaculia bacterium]|nr:response regulator [Thermoanaerobaculia bacterium]
MIQLLKKPRVLVLDDDLTIQRVIAKLLQREGFRVDVASTGRQAIEKIARVEYDVLLLDLMMPTEGGMTVIRHLSENNAPLLDRVILVTASPESVLRTASKEIAGVVKKPFDADELLATIRGILQK